MKQLMDKPPFLLACEKNVGMSFCTIVMIKMLLIETLNGPLQNICDSNDNHSRLFLGKPIVLWAF